MKVFVVFSTLLAVAMAVPSVGIPLVHSGLIFPASYQNRFHAQDEFGQYSYGYSEPHSTKQEVRSFDGTTRGSYSYVDAEGKLQTVDYTADSLNGFRVAATNLPKAPLATEAAAPKPVEDTPEVILAKEAHFAAIDEAKTRTAAEPVTVKSEEIVRNLPRPVEDTLEVTKARAEHLAAKELIELRSSTELPAVHAVHLSRAPVVLRTAAFPHAFAFPYNVNPAFPLNGQYIPAPFVL